MHTPGHTPESQSLLITDLSRGPKPWMVLAGDALFVGDVGLSRLRGREAFAPRFARREIARADVRRAASPHRRLAPSVHRMRRSRNSTANASWHRSLQISGQSSHILMGRSPRTAVADVTAENRKRALQMLLGATASPFPRCRTPAARGALLQRRLSVFPRQVRCDRSCLGVAKLRAVGFAHLIDFARTVLFVKPRLRRYVR